MAPSAAPFPTPYAGTYYPMYGAWQEPNEQMRFDLVSTLPEAVRPRRPRRPMILA